ncbi:MAG: hypothetical protein ABL957_00475 [Parvularculaceae bacterium]
MSQRATRNEKADDASGIRNARIAAIDAGFSGLAMAVAVARKDAEAR